MQSPTRKLHRDDPVIWQLPLPITNAPVTEALRGRISAGRFSADLTVYQNRLSHIEQYRPDTYDVVIDAAGYRTWGKDVRLKMDECHIIPMRFTVKMVK